MVPSQTYSANQPNEQRYRHLFENMPICIFVINLTVNPAVILEVNRRAELVYGYPAAEVVGCPAAQLVPEESRAILQNILQRVQRGELVTAEILNRHRDGTTFPVRITATLDPTHHGYMITTVEDISAEKLRRSEAEAIEAERLRIAHEIHDGVAQNLAGLRFKSALWHHLADSAPPEMRGALDELQAVLITAIEDIRRAIFALRPMDLEALGFVPALRQWVAGFGEQNQMLIQLDVSRQTDYLPAVYELPLFRIIQEGMNNIRQHAQASTALVHLTVDETGGVALLLQDNGCGFDPQQVTQAGYSRHFGLRQMRERILALGGTLDIHSEPGRGTDLLIRLPSVSLEPRGSNSSRIADASD
jgi:PAS domain S-box-containing protein